MKNKALNVNKLKEFTAQNTIYIIFVIMVAAMSIMSDTFLTVSNIRSLLTTESAHGIMALGMAFPLISGGIDLSVAAIMPLAGCLSASMVQDPEYVARIFPELSGNEPLILAILVGLAVGLAAGALNGILIAYLQMPPFVCTLATTVILNGITYIITNSVPVSNLRGSYKAIGQYRLFGEIPMVIIYFAVLSVIAWVILNYTRFGKQVYAVGGNRNAALISGIKIEKVTVKIYVWTGLMAAIVGIVVAARSGSAIAGSGAGYELDAIAACTIGGVSGNGGVGKVSGIIVGVLILGVINNVLLLMGTNAYLQLVVRGVVIILAVVFDMMKMKKQK